MKHTRTDSERKVDYGPELVVNCKGKPQPIKVLPSLPYTEFRVNLFLHSHGASLIYEGGIIFTFTFADHTYHSKSLCYVLGMHAIKDIDFLFLSPFSPT